MARRGMALRMKTARGSTTRTKRTTGKPLGSFAMATMLLVLAAPSHAQPPGGPVVVVDGGRVQGRPLPTPGGAVFKGIPYAAPPVGNLRWADTYPVNPWEGVLQAGTFRTGCGLAPEGTPKGSTDLQEDCLYLNVWTPKWPAKGKTPVMLWIPGGELGGSSGALRPGSESLVRHGVILVSANYRGTLLGMMTHPEATAQSPHHASGNWMLQDEVAVLKWIHANIARFGGDPDNVTVFGQSAGGHFISMLLTSPLTKGLITRAIIESGAPVHSLRPYLREDQLERIGVVTAQVLHAPTTGTFAWLRAQPVATIVAAMPEVRKRLFADDNQALDEGTDGYVIPKPPSEVWIAHGEAPVPLIIGNAAHDTLATMADVLMPDGDLSSPEVVAWTKRVLELFYARDPDLLARALKNYGVAGQPNSVSTYPPYGTPAQQLAVDLTHRCASNMTAALHSTLAPTWRFEFSRETPGHPPYHGSELRYVFGDDTLEDAATRRQSQIMQRYWTNFAKTGNPNGPGLPVWQAYEPNAQASIEFAFDGPVARKASRAVPCSTFTEKYLRHPDVQSGGPDHVWYKGLGGKD